MTDLKLIHIVDDEDSVRRSVGFTLKTSGFAVDAWSSGQNFLNNIKHAKFGCILLDLSMPHMDGLEVQHALVERGITMPIIFMSGHGDIPVAIHAMKAGAIDYLEKPFTKAALLRAIDEAFERTACAARATARTADARQILGTLTPREHNVLEGLAKGMANKNIAYELNISPRTVEVHRANMMTKLGAHKLSDALRIAFSAGLGD